MQVFVYNFCPCGYIPSYSDVQIVPATGITIHSFNEGYIHPCGRMDISGKTGIDNSKTIH